MSHGATPKEKHIPSGNMAHHLSFLLGPKATAPETLANRKWHQMVEDQGLWIGDTFDMLAEYTGSKLHS